ncbi:MAG: hypothetical protein JNM24_17455 [Bdellovibrionaceae bacterium]|nr:hypothetical protein [Pseudobdellovibrionaceae bacterium]
MAAIKQQEFWRTFVYLKEAPSNTVANKLLIKDNMVRGFIGIKENNQFEIFGGVCWGSGDPNNGGNLIGITFSLESMPRKTKINLLSQPIPSVMSDEKCTKQVENFVHRMLPKAIEKMIKHLKNKKGKGRYSGRRMEAHRRGNTINTGDFFDDEKDNLFTTDFIKLARQLTITYR